MTHNLLFPRDIEYVARDCCHDNYGSWQLLFKFCFVVSFDQMFKIRLWISFICSILLVTSLHKIYTNITTETYQGIELITTLNDSNVISRRKSKKSHRNLSADDKENLKHQWTNIKSPLKNNKKLNCEYMTGIPARTIHSSNAMDIVNSMFTDKFWNELHTKSSWYSTASLEDIEGTVYTAVYYK